MTLHRQKGTPDELARLAREIVKRRKALGWTQSELSRKAKMSVKTLHNIESALNWPSLGTYAQICRALGWEVPQGM